MKTPALADTLIIKNGGKAKTTGGIDIISVSASGVPTVTGAIVAYGSETIAGGGTSTALDLTKTVHDVDADAGGDIFTVAAGTLGQIIVITCKTATGVATITPATFLGGTSVTLNAIGDSVTLIYTVNGWAIMGGNGYSIV